MTKQTTKDVEVEVAVIPEDVEAVEAEATPERDVLAEGISAIINDVIAPTIEATNVSMIAGHAQTIVELQITSEDLKATFDPDMLEFEAASFISEMLVGALSYNLWKGSTDFGPAGIKRQFKTLNSSIALLQRNKGDVEHEERVLKALNWFVKYQMQQSFRLQLIPVANAIYRKQTGMDWTAPSDKAEAVVADAATVNAINAMANAG